MTKTVELRQKDLPELQKLLKELREKSFELRLLKARNQLKRPHLRRVIKKDIARVLTVLGQKVKA